MNEGTSFQLAALAAYGAVAVDAAMFVTSLFSYHSSLILHAVTLLTVMFQLLLLPVVAMLPAEPWARASGYGSRIVGVVANVMFLNGVSLSTCSAVGLGAYILAALWIASASWEAKSAIRSIDFLLVLILFVYPLGAVWLPRSVLLPEFVLFPIWLILVGRELMSRARLHRLLATVNWR